MTSEGPVHERISKLFDYLEELDRATRRVYRDVRSDHRVFYRLGRDFTDLPDLRFDQVDEEGEPIWLEIPRLRADGPPRPPESIAPWIKVPNDPDRSPEVQDTLTTPLAALTDSQRSMLSGLDTEAVEGPITLKRDDHPALRGAVRAYQDRWKGWARSERKRRRVIDLYQALFDQAHNIEESTSEEPLELIWGVGVAAWQPEADWTICYPLITQSMEVELDDRSLALRVRPRDRLPEPEVDVYRELECPGVAEYWREATAELDEAQDRFSPFAFESYEPLLRKAAGHFDTRGVYLPDAVGDHKGRNEPATQDPATGTTAPHLPCVTTPDPSDSLQVSDDWALFIRRRSNSVITQDIGRLRATLADKGDPGPIVSALVQEPPDELLGFTPTPYRGLSAAGFPNQEVDPSEAEDLYFPLPYNEEQVRIIQGLDQSAGIVVQGPPGTGKTHTITNVLCHYLATGRRVLVTSEREPALRVIQRYIPESVRPFTVNLLASDREGLRELERTVHKLANEVSYLDPHAVERELEEIEARIDALHRRLTELSSELEAIAQEQFEPATFFGKTLLPMDLAHRVVQQEGRHGWFPDRLDPQAEPAFDEGMIVRLRELRKQLGSDLFYLQKWLPHPKDLMDPTVLGARHGELIQQAKLRHRQRTGELPPLGEEGPEALGKANALRAELEALQEALEAADTEWKQQVRMAYAAHFQGGGGELPMAALDELRSELEALREERNALMHIAVEIPEGTETDPELIDAIHKAAARGRPRWHRFRRATIRRTLEAIRVDAHPPANAQEWQIVAQFVDFLGSVAALKSRWNRLALEFDAPSIDEGRMEAARVLSQRATELTALRELGGYYDRDLPKALQELLPRAVDVTEITRSPDALERVLEILESHLEMARLERARQAVNEQHETVTGTEGTLLEEIQRFLRQTIGHPEIDRTQVEAYWEELHRELVRLMGQKEHLETVRELVDTIEASGAPEWARRLREEPASTGHDPLIPEDWWQAWEWSRAATYLQRIDRRDRFRELTKERVAVEQDLADQYKALVEHRVQLAIRRNMSPKVRSSLESYLSAIVRLGKGTGKRAARHRKEAQEAMAIAHRAVPCWIMPHSRISEALPAETEAFDLVIVDEASQSNAWSLPSLVRARQVLVVGDDKQVSPLVLGLRETDINYLIHKHLADLPNRYQLAPENSLYDLARVVFPQEPVRLREHFRCVEPIIQFSNRLCYDGEMEPLRIPTAEERLDPPLVDVFVRDGHRQGEQKINRPEVEAIITEIGRLIEDPRTQGRSIGVVSLLGHEQARLVHDRLLRELGEEVLARHDIRCGDASYFQGSEADIVMLSMVDDASHTRAQRDRTREQRFNVAASRARDRLYLFRSLPRERLKDDDLRARLIDHLASAVRGELGRGRQPHALWQSEFEQDLYNELRSRGYRVKPHVRAGSYRIDLVVEGSEGRRLAVELDGDQHHSPGRWQEDVQRQRVLERVGWSFWRCWGSTYTLHREECLQDLEATLANHGVTPTARGDDSPVPETTEYREVVSTDLAAQPPSETTAPGPAFESDELTGPTPGLS